MPEYTAWAVNEPQISPRLWDCAAADPSNDSKWYVADCSIGMPVLCQIDRTGIYSLEDPEDVYTQQEYEYGVKKNISHWLIFFTITAVCQVVASVLKNNLGNFYRWVPSTDSEQSEVSEVTTYGEDSDYIYF